MDRLARDARRRLRQPPSPRPHLRPPGCGPPARGRPGRGDGPRRRQPAPCPTGSRCACRPSRTRSGTTSSPPWPASSATRPRCSTAGCPTTSTTRSPAAGCRCSPRPATWRRPARAPTTPTRASTSPPSTTCSPRPSTTTRSCCRPCGDATSASCSPRSGRPAPAPVRARVRWSRTTGSGDGIRLADLHAARLYDAAGDLAAIAVHPAPPADPGAVAAPPRPTPVGWAADRRRPAPDRCPRRRSRLGVGVRRIGRRRARRGGHGRRPRPGRAPEPRDGHRPRARRCARPPARRGAGLAAGARRRRRRRTVGPRPRHPLPRLVTHSPSELGMVVRSYARCDVAGIADM